jgi:hypothetical protein
VMPLLQPVTALVEERRGLAWTEPELKPVSGVAQVSVMGH